MKTPTSTTTAQFEIMVDYMETHGDISKQNDGSDGNWRTAKHWHKLCKALNEAGITRTTIQWRKVWSDLKNNSKKKQFRIKQKANSPGGLPRGYRTRLTDLERRALAVVDAANGVSNGVKDEVPVSQMVSMEDIEAIDFPCNFDISTDDINHVGKREPSPGSDFGNDSEVRDQTCTESVTRKCRSQRKANKRFTFPSDHMYTQRSDLSRHKTEYEPNNYEMENRNIIRLKEIELNQQTRLKEMEIQHQTRLREMELQQQTRLKELELQQQGRWQELFTEFLSIMKKIVADKYDNTNT